MIRSNKIVAITAMVLSIFCMGYNFGPEDTIINQLLNDEIVKKDLLCHELTRQGKKVKCKSDLLCVTLKSGIKGVFKPSSERSIYAEVAAYKASRSLGFSLVPPTVIRTIDGKVGSLQLFVNTNLDPMVHGDFEHALMHAGPAELANLKIFYYVFGHWDVRRRNILVNAEKGHIQFIAIDNECIWHRQYWRYGDDPFVNRDWKGLPTTNEIFLTFPYDKYRTIKNPDQKILKETFGPTIPQKYIKWFSARNPLHYIFYGNSLWIQFQGDVPRFAFTNYYPQDTIARLKTLNKPMLLDIFSHAKGAKFLTEDFLNSILERRDQLLAHYEQQERSSKK